MQYKIRILIISLLLGLSSCTVFSVHPLYDDASLTTDDNLVGQWLDVSDSETYVKIEPIKTYYINNKPINNYYTLTRADKGDTIWYDAHYLRLNNNYYLDLYPTKGGGIEPDDMMIRNYFPVHTFLKLELLKDKVNVLTFDENKLLSLFKQNRIRLQHEMVDDYVLITASTRDLQKFIEKYSTNKEVFSQPDVFIRLKK